MPGVLPATEVTAGGRSPPVPLERWPLPPQPWHCRRPTDPSRGCVGCCVCEERAASARCSGVIVDSGARDRCWRPPRGPRCSGLGPLGPISTSGPCHWLAWRSPRRGAWHLQAWREGEPCQAQWGGGEGPGLPLMEQVSQTKMQDGLGERVGARVWCKQWPRQHCISTLQAEASIPVTRPRTWGRPRALLWASAGRGQPQARGSGGERPQVQAVWNPAWGEGPLQEPGSCLPR